MLSKKDLEDQEEQLCAPYAVLSKHSRGRAYQEPPPESRTEYQRDRDRVVHAKAFRRLKHKTQVFVATEDGDHYRTRLTHTLEVAQIARHIARVLQLNEDLTETIALAHDLGHTPFGHAGEEILDKLMRGAGGFEHNRQSRKIVEKLEKKYIEFNGLNLTYEVLDGLIKHRTPYDHGQVNSAEQGPSLEAQIVNIADEIAYNSHDLDDGLTSGLISGSTLNKLTIWQELSALHKQKYPGLTFNKLLGLNIRRLIHQQVVDVLQETENRIKQYKIQTRADVLNSKNTLVDFSSAFFPQVQELRQFLRDHFYNHPRIIKRNEKAAQVITALFEYYQKHPELAQASSMFLQESSLKEAISDYIAGMTDQFATNAYRKIQEA